MPAPTHAESLLKRDNLHLAGPHSNAVKLFEYEFTHLRWCSVRKMGAPELGRTSAPSGPITGAAASDLAARSRATAA